MAYVDKITKGAASYDMQDARLANLTASVADLNKTSSTTLAGFGITDANINGGVITLGSNNITPLTSSSELNAANLAGIAAVDTTGNAATSDKVNHALTIGSSNKVYDGSAAQIITAADLGLEQALIFKGITTTDLDDGDTTSPINMDTDPITTLTPAVGNVVITKSTVSKWPNTEFVWANGKWNKLGDAKSYIMKSEAPGYADILTQTSAAATYATQTALSDVADAAAIKAYPVVTSTGTMAWNQEYRLGSISALSVTMPAPATNYTSEVRFTFTAGAAFTPSLTCPNYTVLGTGDVSIANGKVYEMSYCVLDATHIGVACKEWA